MSGLPAYTIEKRERGWLYLRCPRRACQGVFAVRPKKWAESWHGHGRSCPYCFKANKMPAKRSKKRNRSKSAKISSPAN
jgi:hypothetical protein